MSFSRLLGDLKEYIDHGGRHDRILVTVDGHNILATGIGRHDDGFALEFNGHKYLDTFKRRTFKKFCVGRELETLKRWKTPECVTCRAELPGNEYQIIEILKAYFKDVHNLDGDYDIQIHKRVWG